jgi:hypothetical protein
MTGTAAARLARHAGPRVAVGSPGGVMTNHAVADDVVSWDDVTADRISTTL